jgi:hypothetical protein
MGVQTENIFTTPSSQGDVQGTGLDSPGISQHLDLRMFRRNLVDDRKGPIRRAAVYHKYSPGNLSRPVKGKNRLKALKDELLFIENRNDDINTVHFVF